MFILQRNTGYFLIQVRIYSTLKQKLCVLSVWLDLKSGMSLNKGRVKKKRFVFLVSFVLETPKNQIFMLPGLRAMHSHCGSQLGE